VLDTFGSTAIGQFAIHNPAMYAKITALEQFNNMTILDKWVRNGISWYYNEADQGWRQYGWGVVQFSAEQGELINQAYDALKTSVYGALVVQTRLKPYLDSIELVIDEAGVRFDTTALKQCSGFYTPLRTERSLGIRSKERHSRSMIASGVTCKAFANCNKVTTVGTRTPRSSMEIKVRSTSASNARVSCDRPRSLRSSRSSAPN
jgi:hypothetical protein